MHSRRETTKVAIFAVIVIAIVAIVIIFAVNSSGFRRAFKSFKSDYTGGLDRTVTVYDYNGNEIKSWSGKFDVQESESRVFFDQENGKRVIIYNGIVINEEN